MEGDRESLFDTVNGKPFIRVAGFSTTSPGTISIIGLASPIIQCIAAAANTYLIIVIRIDP